MTVASIGYKGIEVSIQKEWFDWTQEEDTKRLENMLHQNGLSVPAVCWRPLPRRELGDLKYLEEATQYLRDCIRVAERFRAKHVLIWPRIPEGVPKANARDAVSQTLINLRDDCKSQGVGITIEFESSDSAIFQNYKDVQEVISEVGKYVSICCDTYHMFNRKMDPYKAVIEQGENIGVVHLSDSHRLPPGLGEFNFIEFFQGLKDITYKGPFFIQIDPRNEEDIKTAYINANEMVNLNNL
jgi:protein FrlC